MNHASMFWAAILSFAVIVYGEDSLFATSSPDSFVAPAVADTGFPSITTDTINGALTLTDSSAAVDSSRRAGENAGSAASARPFKIAGWVRDKANFDPIGGAVVHITGSTGDSAITGDSTGMFTIMVARKGLYELAVSAPEYLDGAAHITVSASETVMEPIFLSSKIATMQKMTVMGRLEGQAGALNKQRNADNLKNVVDAELIEKLPDNTTADALQRVSGVSLKREQGEGSYIQIRGTESRLSTVTINGQSISAPDGDTRAVALNVIPSDQLAEIVVSKVLMPEMDGDAIGGTVDLVTSSAKDEKLAVKLNLMPGYTALSNTPIWQGSASIGKRFLDKNALGFFLGGSYYKSERETDAVTMHWDTTVYKRVILDTSEHAADHLTNMQFRQSNKINERIGASGKLDYHFNENTTAYLSASYNRYANQEYRRSLSLAISGQDARIEQSDFFVVRTVPVTRSIRDRYKEQNITSVTLGGETKLGDLKLDAAATYSDAQTREPNRIDIGFSKTFNIKYSVDDPDNPEFLPFDLTKYLGTRFSGTPEFVYDSAYDNMALYKAQNFTLKNETAHEQTIGGKANAMFPFELFSQSVEAKTGLKVSQHTKDQTVVYTHYIASGGPGSKIPDMYLPAFLDDYSNSGFYNGRYTLNRMPDPDKVRDYYIPAPDGSMPDTTLKSRSPDPETYTATDRNAAGYVQAKMKSGPLLLIGGVRLEYTSMHYSGYKDSLLFNNYQFTHPVEMYRSYLFALPMVLGKYSITNDINVRASYTRSFSRPDWYDLVPISIKLSDNSENGIPTYKEGNPDLKPTTSNNVDVSMEYYNSPGNFLSAGVFYKRMNDYIFSTSNNSKPLKDHIDTLSNGNGDLANLAGIETNVQQKFTFLPGFLSGFGINGNYTYTWSKTLVPGFTEESPLPGQSEHVANAGLYYEKYGFAGRIALNFQSHFISEISSYTSNMVNTDILFQNTCVGDHLQLDCSVSQKIGKHVTLVVEASNLTNEPYKIYLGDPNHTQQREFYSWSAQGGIRLGF
jgi:TonB-dependent receptor